MPVPNVFGNATASIPLSQLDVNFNTVATLGNASIGLGNTTTTVGNLTLTNVTLSSGTSNMTLGNTAVTIGSATTSVGNLALTNVTITTIQEPSKVLATQGNTAYYNSVVQVDGNTVTPKWQGGTAPTSGNASSIDSYTYVIIKTGSAAFTVLAAQTKFA